MVCDWFYDVLCQVLLAIIEVKEHDPPMGLPLLLKHAFLQEISHLGVVFDVNVSVADVDVYSRVVYLNCWSSLFWCFLHFEFFLLFFFVIVFIIVKVFFIKLFFLIVIWVIFIVIIIFYKVSFTLCVFFYCIYFNDVYLLFGYFHLLLFIWFKLRHSRGHGNFKIRRLTIYGRLSFLLRENVHWPHHVAVVIQGHTGRLLL